MENVKYEISEAGIKWLDKHSNDDQAIEHAFRFNTFLDLSDLGNGDGIKYQFTLDEIGNRWPVLARWIDSHLPYAMYSKRLSVDEKINVVTKNEGSRPYIWRNLKIIREQLMDETLLKYANDEDLPDKLKPYCNFSDKEIFDNVPGLDSLSGARTKTGLRAIRNMRYPAPPLKNIKIKYKKTWREAKNQIRIGQTNGRGGFCTEACFLVWNSSKQ